MYQTDPKASKLCLLQIRYKIRVKYDERAINEGLKKQYKITYDTRGKTACLFQSHICQAHEVEHSTACHNCFVESFLFPFLLFYETYTTYRGLNTDIHTHSDSINAKYRN